MSSGHPPIRTFHARLGRTTPTIERALAELGPRLDPRAWRREIGRPLVLEVGCGHGEAAIGFARAHPDHDLVAYDVYPSGVAHLLQAIDDQQLTNVRAACRDVAVELLDHHAPASLRAVHVFFPDPWPKTRHHKRRFIRPDIVDLVVDRLAPGGLLLLATDIDDYARSARAVLDRNDLLDGGPSPRPEWRPITGYESKALAANRPIQEFRYQRR